MHVRAIHWVAFLAIVFGISAGGFGFLERSALNDPNGLSLSQFTVNMIYAWPPVVFIAGLAIGLFLGILTTHFLWPWVPLQKRVTCGECGQTILKGN